MTLLQRLLHANDQGPAILAQTAVSYRQLINNALQLRQQYPQLQQHAVAITFTDLTSFITALLAFDGWCRALYLMPDNLTDLPSAAIRWPLVDTLPVPLPQSHTEPSLWYLATSGTTGTPKWIGHSADNLSRKVKATAYSSTLRWALCYQPVRFAGMQVLLQSLLSGAAICDCSSGDMSYRISQMQRYNVNAVSATPSLWRQLLMTGQLNTLSLEQLTLGGEIADQPLLDTLSAMFPQAKLLHIYASTEAGVGFAVADKQAGFPACWLGTSQNGLSFKLDAQQHLWLKPPCEPDSSLASRLDSEGFLNTEDVVMIQGDRVHFLGRASGVINVGGNKVHPEQVEQVLLQHLGVQQAKVYAKASSILGQLVVADIVTAHVSDTTALQTELLKHCQQHLQRYQIPARFNFVSRLTTNATGKLSRKANEGAS